MCGIAAFSGHKGLTPSQVRLANNKMKILGLYNESRGEHGCGMYINGRIYKGFEDTAKKTNTKHFSDFIGQNDWVMPELDAKAGSVVILHTRRATHGAHVEANNHPFHIESETDKRNDIVGVHNGTISNIWDLCNKNGVKHTYIHVDSKALYTLLEKVGLEILEQYKGFAALVWTKPAEPNSLYVFHGASRKTKDGELFEERPMYYLKTGEGIYFSSMWDALNAIRETADQIVEELEFNQVFKVTNGKFTSSKKYIPREDSNLEPVYVAPVRSNSDYRRNNSSPAQQSFNNFQALASVANSPSKGPAPELSSIWDEPVPYRAVNKDGKNRIYFWKGRYWHSGEIICNGVMYLSEKGRLGAEGDTDVKPYYFWAGVMLNGLDAYDKVKKEAEATNSWVMSTESNYAYHISKFAAHPVTNLPSEGTTLEPMWRFAWYDGGKRCYSKKFPAKFGSRTYVVKDAFLEEIISSDPQDRKLLEKKEDDPKQMKLLLEAGRTYPSENSSLGATKVVPSNEEGQSFDIVFEDLDTAAKEFTKIEVQAMRQFTEDTLKEESSLDPDQNEIDAEMWTSIRTAINAGITIRQGLGDRTGILDMYVDMIKSKGGTKFVAPQETVDDDDTERFQLAYGYGSAEEVQAAFPGIQQGFHSHDVELDDESMEEGGAPIRANESVMDLVDAAIERAEIQRAMDNDKREQDNEEARDKVEDLINILAEVRNGADELQAMVENDLAQEVALVIYCGVDSMRANLADAVRPFNIPEVQNLLK